MKFLISVAVMALYSANSRALALLCAQGEVHKSSVVIVAEADCAQSGLAIRGRDVSTCVLTELKDLLPGTYQICGSYQADPNFFFVRVAVDARLR